MHDTTLRFVHSTAPPATDVRVFDAATQSVLGAPFTFRVVGSSHYVSAPAYDFHELSSCEPVSAPATEIDLDSGQRRRVLTFENDAVAARTVVERRPLAAFPGDASFDLAYEFGPDAVTAIDVREDGYVTYHTYPEFDLALYTATRFTEVRDGDRPAADRPASPGATTD